MTPDFSETTVAKHLVIVAYHAPPLGGIAAIRVAKLAKHLAQQGWIITLVTHQAPKDAVLDTSLAAELPESVTVIPIAYTPVAQKIRKLLGKWHWASAWLNRWWVPDETLPWAWAAKRWLKNNPQLCDAIVSSSPTPVAHLIGQALKRQNPNAVWVMDLRDEWSLNPNAATGGFIHACNKGLERQLFNDATYIGVINEALKCKYTAVLPEAMACKLRVLPNGFDDEQMASIRALAKPKEPNAPFTIAYAGSFYGNRTPEVFFAALQLLKDDGRLLPNQLHVVFYGKTKGYKPSVEGVAFTHGGVLPYEDTLKALLAADVLLHISSLPDATGGKVFDTMGLHKPMLALIHRSTPHRENDLEAFLEPTGLSTVAQYNDVEAVAAALEGLLRRWQGGDLERVQPNIDYIHQFTRQATALAFHQLLSR
ncbi:MAG: hypothetical protein QE263_04565 [Vampirovibrionales bacterium]|nr:hypothetical protein [Vampirovibrionales bacterium]